MPADTPPSDEAAAVTNRKKLEAYKSVNARLNFEVDEFYSIQQLFLSLQTIGVLGIVLAFYQFEVDGLILVPLGILFLTARQWNDINRKVETWRNYWLENAKQ